MDFLLIRLIIISFLTFNSLITGYGQIEFCSDPINADSMMFVKYWHSVPIYEDDEHIKSYGKYHVEVGVSEIPDDCGWKISVRNWADLPFLLLSEEGVLPFICEARNRIGFWRPIEYIPTNWCLVDWHNVELKPTDFLEVYRPKYTGDFKTKIRFKLQIGAFVFYSNTIVCYINKEQFRKPGS